MAAHFLQALGYSSMIMLPLYLDHLDASRSEVGTIMAMSALGGLALRPAVGWALDAVGRKTTLMAGTALLCVAMGLVWFVDDLGVLIYIDRILLGISIGALLTGYFTMAADIVPESRRTEGLALFGISGLLPLALNPFYTTIGIEADDLRWFYPLVGVAIFVSLFFIWLIPEPASVKRHKKMSLRLVIGQLLQPRLLPVWWATVIFAALVSCFMAFSTISAQSRGIESSTSIWLTYTCGAISVRLFGARLPDMVGTSNMVAPALGVYGAAMLLAAVADSTALFMAAGALAGFGHGYCFPVLTSQVVSRAEDAVRGTALATFTGFWDAAALALTPLFGMVSDLAGDRVMFSLIAVCTVIALALWAVGEHRVSRGARASIHRRTDPSHG